MIEIRHFQLVRAIAETGSMTKASHKLFLTQPSLSHQLKEIETRLGSRLFLRVNKTMVLTPEGQKVLQAADDILSKVSVLEREIAGQNASARQLRITTQCYTCYHWLPLLMKRFQGRAHDTEIDIVPEAMTDPVAFLLRGEIDLAITNNMRPAAGIRYERLFDDELVVLVPSGHRLASKKVVQPADFTGEHLIIYKEDVDDDYFAKNVLMPRDIRLGKVIRMQLTEARVELVKAGMGLSVLSRWLVKPFVRESSALRLLPIGKRGLHRTWYVATLEQKKNEPVVRDFIRFLKEQDLGS